MRIKQISNLLFVLLFLDNICFSANITNAYITTGTCTLLTNQPANVCLNTQQLFCYDTDNFVNSTSALNLAGHTFTATKTTPDVTNKDGGIWLCDNNVSTLPVFFVQKCTPIGHNRRDVSNTVEFTIPTGAIDRRVVAVSINAAGLVTSGLSNFSLCVKNIIINNGTPSDVIP